MMTTTDHTESKPIGRTYFRCRRCLTSVTLEDSRLAKIWTETLRCQCGGGFERMGRVRKTCFGDVSSRCKCDARCTHASGPSCDCSCGGKNHGAGAAGFVEVWADKGQIVVRPWCPEDSQKRADEFLAALAGAIERTNRLARCEVLAPDGTHLVKAFVTINRQPDRALCSDAMRVVSKSRRGLIHSVRIKALKGILPNV